MAELPRITFRKQVSDGNYGTEAAEISVDVPADVPVTEAFEQARAHVNAALASSPSVNVRRAINPPLAGQRGVVPHPTDDEDQPF